MKKLFLTISLAFGLLSAEAQTGDLPRVAPEQAGVKSKQVVAFFDSLMSFSKTDIHSAIVMRHGKVIGEIHPAPFKAEYSHTSSPAPRHLHRQPSVSPSANIA